MPQLPHVDPRLAILLSNLIPSLAIFTHKIYLTIFTIAFFESLAFIGLFVPGTVFLIGAGVLSIGGKYHIGNFIWAAAIGGILGDAISFYLGRKGTAYIKKYPNIFKPDALRKGHLFFEKYGPISIFAARFIGPIRPIIPFVAGISTMSGVKFFIYNILSAFFWSISYIVIGFFGRRYWILVESIITRTGLFLVVILLAWYILKNSNSSRPSSHPDLTKHKKDN